MAQQAITPILKWAGGKRQLLDYLLPKLQSGAGKYIEPLIGGGAVFFALNRAGSVIADSNPELINMYQQVANDVEGVIKQLKTYTNDEGCFYATRELDWKMLSFTEAAARMIYLNRTCFNGLYRVNKEGQFNVPFGKYKNPKILDVENLRRASALLKQTKIVCEDFAKVLKKYAKPGDSVFLDPPYFPVSEYSDFKRYTKEQFSDDDQARVAEIANQLSGVGCNVVVTNSNHPSVFNLYENFAIEVVPTKRHISSKANSRTGQDVIIFDRKLNGFHSLDKQCEMYPKTRYMGSKVKLLSPIWDAVAGLDFNSVLDIFSGSGIVSYMFKSQGKQVFSNDYMFMSTVFTKAMVENSEVTLDEESIEMLLTPIKGQDDFVSRTFAKLYYSDDDNHVIDTIRDNIPKLDDEYKQAIAMSALIRACLKKRPRGIFTYTGYRYDDGRKDLKMTMEEQFIKAVKIINDAVFNNGQNCFAYNGDALGVKVDVDLVYMDPPYYSPLSDNEYVRRYHFVEGLAQFLGRC